MRFTAAVGVKMPAVLWQRCHVHLQHNAFAYVPKIEMRRRAARDIRAWPSRLDGQKHT